MGWIAHARLGLILVSLYGCTSEQEKSNQGCATTLGSPICQDREPDRRPLVVGSNVLVYTDVGEAPADGERLTYQVSSDAPDIVELRETQIDSECGQQSVRVSAKKAGVATLRFEGPLGDKSVQVQVEDPTRISVAPFLDELASGVKSRDGNLPPKEVDELAQVTGGVMRWRIRYFGSSANTELRGRGAATVSAPAFVTSSVLEASERDVFELTGNAEGTGEVEVKAGAISLKMPLRVVPQAAVRSVQLFVQDDGADAGTTLNAMARAFDEADKPVYGAQIKYVFGGREIGAGDYLSYEVRSGARTTLDARSGEVRAYTTLPADDTSNPQVHSDRELVDCSVGGGVDGRANFVLLAVGVGLVLRRARRRGRRD